MNRIATFGEVMIRLDAPDNGKIRQAVPGTLNTTFAGAETNVAVSLAHLGTSARFVTVLPDNALTDACAATLRSFGVETDFVHRSATGRFGTFYVETGANQRASSVLYDRDFSSISLSEPSVYNWPDIFTDVNWFHLTGITPALSQRAAAAAIESVKTARELGVTVSCDLNFRNKLWRWEPGTDAKTLAERTMRELLPFVDVLIANEEDASSMLGLTAPGSDLHKGLIRLDDYAVIAREIASRFPQLRLIATTLRESLSATHNRWGAMLFNAETGETFNAPQNEGEYQPYDITSIVDRVGAGDSFAAALIYALTTSGLSAPQDALEFAAAASCLAHSIRGDFNLS